MAALIVAVAAGTVVSVTVEPDGVSHHDIATQFAALLLAAAAVGPDDGPVLTITTPAGEREVGTRAP